MIQPMKLCTAACFWLVSASLYAQVAEELIVPATLLHKRAACGGAAMDAGTIGSITRLDGTGQSAGGDDPIVLCFGEQIFINHNGDAVYDGDPDTGTDPGIGYLFYDCAPNRVTGDDEASLLNDNCLITNSPMPTKGIAWIARGNTDGDIVFNNTGQIQEMFNGGMAKRLWFAPVTLTNFDSLSFDGGTCLDVNKGQGFSVLYLNDIQLLDFSTIPGALMGMMTLAGGMSEVDGLPYTVTLVNVDDPLVTGTVDAAVNHNGTTTFSVPSAGNYLLTITDGQGCSKTFTVSVPANDPVGLCFTSETVPANGSICMPVLVGNFDSLTATAFTAAWDPSVLRLSTVGKIHPSLGNNAIPDVIKADMGVLPFLWFDLSTDGITLADGDTLFEMCFDAIGVPGQSTDLRFTSDPTLISVTGLTAELPFQTKDGSVTITIPSIPAIYANACPDGSGSTGELSYVGFGGIDPYVYTLRNASTGSTINIDTLLTGEVISWPGLDAGTYDIELVDQNGAGVPMTVSVTLSATLFTIDTTVVNPSCMGTPDGKIVIDGIVGNGPFSTTWMADGSTQYNLDSLTDLGPGDYSVIINDINGCADTAMFTLEEDSLKVSFSKPVLPACDGQLGEIEAAVEPARAGDFTWQWMDESGNQVGNLITAPSPNRLRDVPPGQYFLTLSRGGCSIMDSVDLGASKRLLFSMDPATITEVSCPGDTNNFIGLTASADPVANQSPFTWIWDAATINNGTININGDQTSVSNLPSGSYGLTVRDDQGCEKDTTFIITEPDSIKFDLGIQAPSCPDGTNGEIRAFFSAVTGGTQYEPPRPPYDYRWYMLTDSTPTLIATRGSSQSGLSAGAYALAITDANGCTDSTTVSLYSGPNIQIQLDQDLTCPGDSIAQLSVVGDLTGNTIAWSTGSDMETISQLDAGLYQVSVTETINPDSVCTSVDTFRVTDPDLGLIVQSPMQFSPRSLCNEPDSGIIFNLRFTTDEGGPYRYVWENLPNDTLPFLSVSSSGAYHLTATSDRTGCLVYDTVINVQFPERIEISVDTIGPSCNGDTDGSIEVLATGRGGQFDFNWGAPVSSPVSDDTSSLVTGLTAGTYDITVTESADPTCAVTLMLQVSEPDVLTLDIDTVGTQNIRCFGQKDGQISLHWLGGNQDMAPTIRWSGDTISNTLLASGLDAGTYDIVLTDHRGCSDAITIDITEPGEIFATIPQPTEPACNGFQTIVTVNSASGGTGNNYTYSVNNGSTQAINFESSIFAGQHLISVFDEMGCRLDTFIEVSEPPPLTVDLGEDFSVSLGDSARLDATIDALAPIDAYIWTPMQDLSCLNCENPFVQPFESRTYELTVVDTDGCEGRDDIMILVDKARKVYIPNGFTPNNDGLNEIWTVYPGPGVRSIKSIHLFDRWGNLVYQEQGESLFPDGWDGVFDGKLMNPGVFAYLVQVEFIDGRIFTYRGDVTMVY